MRRRFAWRPGWRSAAIFLAMALAVAGLWGYGQFKARRQVEIRANNQYQRAFQELLYHLGTVETHLAKARVSGSRQQLVQHLREVWQEAHAAREELGQLPLVKVSLTRTKTYLNRLEVFSGFLAGEGGRPAVGSISEEDWRTLVEFYRQSKFINSELRAKQAEFATATIFSTELSANTGRASENRGARVDPAVRSLRMVEDGLKRFPEPDLGKIQPPKYAPEVFQATPISWDDALRIAREFIGPEGMEGKILKAAGESGGDIPAYSIEAVPKKTAKETRTGNLSTTAGAFLEISKKGGRVIWYMAQRPEEAITVATGRPSLAEAEAVGTEFLRKRGYPQMVAVSRQLYHNRALISYVYQQDGVLIYPDEVKLQVDPAQKRVVAFEAGNYLNFHRKRQLPRPALPPAQARRQLNPRLEVLDERKALLTDERGREVLAYEFRARLGDEYYLIYVNALSGVEEKIRRVDAEGVEVL
ncbi:MAG: PepSY1/2 domain-containing protein [Syntrophothermus sp.]